MSIAVSLKINDGVVLAADSAATLIGQIQPAPGRPLQTGVVNTYNNANKIFNLKKGLPIGLITWGMGSIGTSSISTLAKDLRKRLSGQDEAHTDWKLGDRYDIKQVAVMVRKFMYEEMYVPAFKDWPQKPELGFIVAGYSHDPVMADMADEYHILIKDGQCTEPTLLRKNAESGLTWSGVPEALTRLVMGFSSALPQILVNVLKVPPAEIPQIAATLQKALTAPILQAAMPLQDAIDLAEFMVDLTINWVRFCPGEPIVAGPIEIAAISKHEGFRWVKRKHYFSKEFNPEELQ